MRVGAVQIGERKAQGNFLNVDKYLEGGNEEKGDRLFLAVATRHFSDRTTRNGCKLKHVKFNLNIENHFFSVRMTEHRHR